MQEFGDIVAGFSNSVHIVGKFGDKNVITSLSLRLINHLGLFVYGNYLGLCAKLS